MNIMVGSIAERPEKPKSNFTKTCFEKLAPTSLFTYLYKLNKNSPETVLISN